MIAYGALKDGPDSRDYPFERTRMGMVGLAMLPTSADLSQFAGPVKNQQHQDCLAFAASSAREMLVRILDNESQVVYSPRYLYLQARMLGALFPQDTGTYSRDIMKALATYGIPTEYQWPYDVDGFNLYPPEYVEKQAHGRRIYAYHRIEDNPVDGIRQSLSEGYPVVLSMQIFGGLMGPRLSEGAVLQEPDGERDVLLGGHAVLLTGYLDDSRVCHAQNSWGVNWGRGGRCWIPYGYIRNHILDGWVMTG